MNSNYLDRLNKLMVPGDDGQAGDAQESVGRDTYEPLNTDDFNLIQESAENTRNLGNTNSKAIIRQSNEVLSANNFSQEKASVSSLINRFKEVGIYEKSVNGSASKLNSNDLRSEINSKKDEFKVSLKSDSHIPSDVIDKFTKNY